MRKKKNFQLNKCAGYIIDEMASILQNVVFVDPSPGFQPSQAVIQAYQNRAVQVYSFLKDNLQYLIDPDFVGFNAELFEDLIKKISLFHQTRSGQ